MPFEQFENRKSHLCWAIGHDAGAPGRRPSGGFGGITHRDFPKPLIAAVNGFAMGGGFEICLACDLVVAEEHASFGLPEVRRGLVAGAGGLVRLGKRLPLPLAMDDRDTVVDLQVAFARAFDQAGFEKRIDYKATPAAVKDEEDRRWLHELLVQMKLRPK